jgi:hypothetical protein
MISSVLVKTNLKQYQTGFSEPAPNAIASKTLSVRDL